MRIGNLAKMNQNISKQDRRIFNGIAERVSELVDSGHWFNQLSVEDKTTWLYSRVHWSADKSTLLNVLRAAS